MTSPTRRAGRYFTEPLEAELRKLRLEVQQLKEQVRAERRRANQHADEVAMIREIQAAKARQWNGVGHD